MAVARATGILKLLGLCVVAGLVVAAIAFPVVGGAGLLSNRAGETVDAFSAELAQADPPLTTTITDRTGKPIAYLYDQDRELVDSAGISQNMKAAMVAIEDHRFEEHNGVDWKGTLRAVVKGVLGQRVEGGSSITQQYVKNYLAYVVAKTDAEREKASEVTAARKLREVRIALQLERSLSKDEILTRYLNVVPFGGNIYGIKAASRSYFNKEPKDLTVPEAAYLAGLVNKPSRLGSDNPVEAKQRRDHVLKRMADTGALAKDPAQAQQLYKQFQEEPLNFSEAKRRPNDCVSSGPTNGFFCDYVIDYLTKLGLNKDKLKRGGYTIQTTLDPGANDAVKAAAEAEVPKSTDGVANAMAVVEPGKDKHRVRALGSNRDFGPDKNKHQTSFNLPANVSRFGAGSIFKIFTAAAAMEEGKTGVNRNVSVPQTYTSSIYKNGGKAYTVKNADSAGDRTMTLQHALATSPNTGFVILEEQAGLDSVVDMSVRLGLRDSMKSVNRGGSRINPDAKDASLRIAQDKWVKDNKVGSFTLGVTVVSVLELANVGATITSGGTWCPPTPIETMTDRNGKPVDLKEEACEQAIDAGLAGALAQGLSQDVINGTARDAAQRAGWNRPMIGKTGTTQNNQSAGFVGATPNFSGAVLTFPDSPSPKPICDTDPPRLCSNGNIFGGKIPARTWFDAMKTIHQGAETKALPPAGSQYQ
ncbi:membrane peptidoglycan carboxypeptidase [Crossiella equi]|uniref:Membrane peptidoglycan carboxypeptidase n=1 Tax=Crossiella equi TaxID=130796 RepID=A0ABS5A973_9PSEU|nr:transglycosylase domain-containing protein [Crossiella equi]MBP2472832.1 membrane peptidoglycan carboxypeptidase [Crossiella equi]